MAYKNLAEATNTIMSHGLTMRKSFDFSKQSIAQWFPGHMAKGMKKMQSKLSNIDCIIEVHDARIPISGRNPMFQSMLQGIKPYVLALNKMDLIDMDKSQDILDYYKNLGTRVIFTDCKDEGNETITKFVPIISDIIQNSNRFNRAEEQDYQIMIIGVPNSGKSSMINILRSKNLNRRKATIVGKIPGITRSVLERIKISESPLIYLLDTPGVLPPQIEDVETGLKLALCNNIKDHLVGENVIADYLLYKMNLAGNHKYVDYLSIDQPTDSIQRLLLLSAYNLNYMKKMVRFSQEGGRHNVPDILRVAAKLLKGYRHGDFGYVELDEIPKSL